MDQPALVDLVETALQNEDIAPLVSHGQTVRIYVGYSLQALRTARTAHKSHIQFLIHSIIMHATAASNF